MEPFEIIGPGQNGYNLPPNVEVKKIKINVNGNSVEIPTKKVGYPPEKDKWEKEFESDFAYQITALCMEMAKFLICKNEKYGNSALEPLRTFSKLSSEEQLLIRMDDKLSRIKNSKEPQKNDIIDLIGYLNLYALKKGWTDLSDLID